MPKFSVIVTEHNSAEWMRKGLDSIRDQTFTDYELIIVCDRCSDNTAEIAREYIRPGTDDRVIEADYGRAGLSRNRGLDEARGEWVLWMDDDDWYLHEFAFQMISETLDMIKEEGHEIDLLCYSFIWKGQGYTRNEPGRLWPAIWNKCWRREFIGEERFPDWKHSDDYGFALKMHPMARIILFDSPLYYYNFMRPGSISAKLENGEFDGTELPPCYQQENGEYVQRLRNAKLGGGLK